MILWVAPQPHNMPKVARNTAVRGKDMINPLPKPGVAVKA
jgi:hypothetical protein